jgi:aryl-alcohol dehydrogenase-like predicted oxidoreductase
VSGFADQVPLGRTGLLVSRIGLGSSYGPSTRACRAAFDAGVNYFFWGSVRTRGMGLALREIAAHERDRLVVVLESYARGRRTLRWSVDAGLRALRIDHADVLLLGWHDRAPRPALLEEAERLREAGKARFLALSSHQRPLLREYVEADRFDAYHVRYNAAHPGAESDIFPYLPTPRPGIVSFTNTRWGTLLAQKHMPPGETAPTAADCYRFALSNPCVDVAIAGPKNDREVEMATSVLATGPLDEDEMARIRRIGAHVHGVRSIMAALT